MAGGRNFVGSVGITAGAGVGGVASLSTSGSSYDCAVAVAGSGNFLLCGGSAIAAGAMATLGQAGCCTSGSNSCIGDHIVAQGGVQLSTTNGTSLVGSTGCICAGGVAGGRYLRCAKHIAAGTSNLAGASFGAGGILRDASGEIHMTGGENCLMGVIAAFAGANLAAIGGAGCAVNNGLAKGMDMPIASAAAAGVPLAVGIAVVIGCHGGVNITAICILQDSGNSANRRIFLCFPAIMVNDLTITIQRRSLSAADDHSAGAGARNIGAGGGSAKLAGRGIQGAVDDHLAISIEIFGKICNRAIGQLAADKSIIDALVAEFAPVRCGDDLENFAIGKGDLCAFLNLDKAAGHDHQIGIHRDIRSGLSDESPSAIEGEIICSGINHFSNSRKTRCNIRNRYDQICDFRLAAYMQNHAVGFLIKILDHVRIGSMQPEQALAFIANESTVHLDQLAQNRYSRGADRFATIMDLHGHLHILHIHHLHGENLLGIIDHA